VTDLPAGCTVGRMARNSPVKTGRRTRPGAQQSRIAKSAALRLGGQMRASKASQAPCRRATKTPRSHRRSRRAQVRRRAVQAYKRWMIGSRYRAEASKRLSTEEGRSDVLVAADHSRV
jgi:hypothetical protein